LHNSAGHLITDDANKADLLNNYYVSVGTIDNGVLPTSVSIRRGTHKLEQIIFTETYVAAAIHKLKRNLSSGPDGFCFISVLLDALLNPWLLCLHS